MNFQKSIVALIVTIFITNFGFNQSQKQADKLFETGRYSEALAMYRTLSDQNFQVKKNTAYCLKNLYRYKEAEEVFSGFIGTDNLDDQTYFDYADVLNSLGNYSKAVDYYNKVSDKQKYDIDNRVNSCLWAKSNANNKSQFKPVKTNIETGGLSLGAAPYQDGLVYSTAQTKSDEQTGEVTRFYNLSFSKKQGETNFDAAKELSSKLNTQFYEGSPSFYGNTLYFTRNSSTKEQYTSKKHKKYKISSKGINTLSIYKTENTSGSWSEPVPLSINNVEYNVTHPSVSEDGSKLYFSSDMPGGYGGYDLYVVTKSNSGNWSNPQNLGAEINSKLDEMFPFIMGKELYFSSRGHKGYGGSDVFVSQYKNDAWSEPKNLGLGVNTAKDDFGFVLLKGGKKGYMSSNREGNNGYDYIYTLKPAVDLDSVLSLVTSSEDGTPIAKPTLLVKNDDLGDMNYTGDNGKIMVKGPKDSKASYIFDADGYDPKVINLDEFDKDKLNDIKLDPRLRGVVTSSISGEPVSGVKVYAIDKETGETVATTITGKDGKWYFVLPEDREYDIVFEKDGFKKKIVNVQPGDLSEEIKIALNAAELQPSTDKGSKVEIRNIYFEFNKATITKEAYKTLDNIVAFLNANPDVRIELSAHTDMVGKDKYNLDLSDKRAKAARDYVVSKGISSSRVVGKGYGEKYILNRCKSYSAKCSDEEHAVNRRVEMKIL